MSKKKYEMICIAAVLLIILLPITVQATITNKGVVKLIDVEYDCTPSYNPEGNKILFSVVKHNNFNDGEIRVLNLDSGIDNQIIIPNSRYLIDTEWSPIGDTIVYSEGLYFHPTDIYINNLDGTNPISLTDYQDFSAQYPSFSPDGSQITYILNTPNSRRSSIWVMDVNGMNKKQLTDDSVWNLAPSWSPDGTKIAYYSGVWPYMHIWVMDADNGENKIQLTSGNGYEAFPSWSPDGRFIAYQKQDNAEDQNAWNIWIMDSDGSQPTQLTNWEIDGLDGGTPDWHPNGNKLVFVSHGNLHSKIDWDIYEMTLGGINQPPVADAGVSYIGDEGSIILLDGSGSSDSDGNIISYEWDLDNDGQYDDATGITTNVVFDDDDIYTIGLKVADENDEVDSDTATVTVNNVAPLIISIENIPVDPVPVGTTILPIATFTDPGTLDTHTAVWDWGGLEEPSSGNVDQNQDTVTCSHIYNTPGIFTIKLTVTDEDSGSGTAVATHYLVVYDSEGGFVTGGGWIDSPGGAYIPKPSLTGKANFGFVSKYKKGATTPTGQTEFQFKVADLNFHSDNYDWLVIAGHKAMYKGIGTINGEGNFGFLLSAVDEALTPSTDVDLFRIKIWDMENNDAVVYDNQMENDEYADPTTVISSGSIVIHKK